MANIVSENEMFFNSFEPKTKNRFIMYLDGVPSYLIRKANRPTLTQEAKELPHINITRHVKGKTKWGTMQLSLYDPVAPSGAQAVMEWVRLHHESVTGRNGYADFYKKDIVINMLGPVGDKVEEWVCKGCIITETNFGDIDWSADDPAEISITIQPDYCILNF
ncbi:MAG: hypothetical protein KY428_07390 [Bacteroidetes bacterium]|nr:hypothetical protein [Bacteroidota bacterium]